MELNIEYLPVDQLTPYEHNARKHQDNDVAAIVSSIRAFGFDDPIGVWGGHNVIVEGHGRLMAAKKLGMEKVPVIHLDHLTDEQRRAYALAHNRTAELSEWDDVVKDLELRAIDELDMSQFGFDPSEPGDVGETVEDDYDIDAPVEARAKLGEIYRLGDHRLMCGDSTSKTDMDRLIGSEPPVFVFTDPPYGVAIGDKNATLNSVQKAGRCCVNIKNDTLNTDDLREMLTTAMSNLRQHCDDGCSYYVSAPQGGALGLMMMMMMRDAGLEVRHNLIWVKNSATFSLGRLDYDYQHEPIFYTWTKKHTFYGGYATTVVDESKPVDKMSKPELKELVRALLERHPQSVVYEDKPLRSSLHPTMKPVKLVARFMTNSSQRGDVVADIFGGSGTSIIAAEQLGRRCRMMELDPHYVDVIIARWEEFTGQRAELINGE